MVEYLLAVSVISIGLAVGFIELTNSTRESFKNASLYIQQPYP
jgi:type II secretory pathway pseudopilin PulG